MSAQVLRLGPFVGGLNKAADPVVIGNEELIDCTNFELDIDGALTARPAIQIEHEGLSDVAMIPFGAVEFDHTTYIFAYQGNATFVSSNFGESWSELNPGSDSRKCVTMAVYDNRVWLPATPGSTNGSISWSVSGGARAENDMPRGVSCVVHKNRLYITPGKEATDASRLHFSAPADFTDWPSANFIDVARGDGTALNNLTVYQDNLLLFKGESTHILAYDLDPTDAILREINSVVGSHGGNGVVQHENTVYVLHHKHIYSIINFNFELVTIRLPFELEDDLPPNTTNRHIDQHISLLGDRLVARFFNKTYVFNLRTHTWSEWRQNDETSTVAWHIFTPLVRTHISHGSGVDDFFAAYSFDMTDSSGYKIIKIRDEHTLLDLEGYGENVFHCVATTKDFDMADPVRYKRLFWWGADLLSGGEIVADIRPITVIFSPTWSNGEDSWNDDEGTWDRPGSTFRVTDTEPADNVFNTNKLIKFHKGLRFRKVNFSVALETDGSKLQPAKIFTMIAVVKTKQTVSERVS